MSAPPKWVAVVTGASRIVALENADFVAGEILHVDGGQGTGL
ncbi:hypothetical protein [Streptomyces sp. NPDC093970]